MTTRYKITVEQMGTTAWTWEIRDVLSKNLGGIGVVARSGTDGKYGCFSSAVTAFTDAVNAMQRLTVIKEG